MVAKPPLQTYYGVLPQMPEGAKLRLLLETGIELVGAEEGSLLAYDADRHVLRFAMTAGNVASEKNLIGQTVPIDQGISGLAAKSGEVQIGAPTFHDIKQVRRRGGGKNEPEAVIAAPMFAGDLLLGVITAVSFQKGKRFSRTDAKLIARFAAIAGLIVDQSRRLRAAGATPARPAEPKAYRGAGRWERRILQSVGNILRHRPEALADLARSIAAIEALAIGDAARRDGGA